MIPPPTACGRLTEQGLVSRPPDPSQKQKVIYSLTEPAIELAPLIAQLGAWGRRHLSPSRELSVRAELVEEGGQELARVS